MIPRPTIFISAVSSELKSSRQRVANNLLSLGYQPSWQEIFGTEQGDLRAMLRQKIDDCNGVVQLVGKCYGAEPPTPDEQFGRVSYTQYEALYAKHQDMKVWYLLLDDAFPKDSNQAEPEELRKLQAAYRHQLESGSQLYHPIHNSGELDASVLKLRNDLGQLRRTGKRLALGMAALLIFIAVLVLMIFHGQKKQTKIIQNQGEQVKTLVDLYPKMKQALEKLPTVESHENQSGEKLSPAEQRTRAYALLEKDLGLEPGSLARELPAFALELYNRGDTTPLMRAKAAYALNKFDEAEKVSAEAANRDRQVLENAKEIADDRRQRAIEEFDLAGLSACQRIQYTDALHYYRQAEQLTDRARDPMEWAKQQWHIAFALTEQGNYAESVTVNQRAIEETRRVRGEEDEFVLMLRNNQVSALNAEGHYVEAETECLEVIKLQEKLLGPENPATLLSCVNLVNALFYQGKYADAEAQGRNLIKLLAKVLGPENPATLGSRNNLAIALDQQNKFAEAETEDREVIKLRQKVLGPEHPDTLMSRMNLANALMDQGKFSEAEAENRKVIKLQEKVLSPEHPFTLMTRGDLAITLLKEGKFAEAETENRDLINIEDNVLGPEHPDTLGTCYELALCLAAEDKVDEAKEFAQRAADGAAKLLGANHPNTIKFEKLWHELQTTNSP